MYLTDLSILCASKINIEVTAKPKGASAGGHGESTGSHEALASARITWTLPDGAEAFDQTWLRWGIAQRTNLPTAHDEMVDFLGATYTRQLKKVVL